MVGQVTIPGAGGTSPYTYSIGNGPFSAQNLFSNLNAVTYVFHVQDSHACITDTTITLFSNPVIAIQGVDGSPLACVNGSNGYIHIQANTINPPLLYSMNGGASQTSSLFNGLGVGTYNVHMADQVSGYNT